MYKRLVLVLLAAAFFAFSHQSVDIAPPIDIHLTTLDVEVPEETDSRTNLNGGPVVSCADEDETRAYIKSVNPSSPCGNRCFQLQPCAVGVNGSEYCLYYLPGHGSLSATAAPTITITVACTDDVEAETVDSFTVTTIPNMPPTFATLSDTATVDGSSTAANDVVYRVAANDPDGDPLFYTLTTNPSTSYLQIGHTDGVIRATDDLKLFCEDSIRAMVTATDMFNRDIGPLDIDITIDNANQPPSVTNLDTTISVDENVGAGFVAHTLDVVDDGIGTIVYHMRSTSSAGLEMFELVGQEVRLKIDPDYERSDTRSTRLYFDLSDGYCNSKTYSLTVNINNVNEPPMYSPDSIRLIVYEGNVREDLLTVVDEDFGDTHTHARRSGTTLFDIDPVTGELFSTSEIDIDNNVEFREYRMRARVTDAGGLRDTSATFVVRVQDANDQPPYFLDSTYAFGVTECTEPGTVLGNVAGDDDDSSFQNNDVFYFGGGGGKLAVLSDGTVVLTQAMIDGEISTGSATITDQGLFPGPLSGTPATITVTAGPCPPPVTPAPATPATGGGGTGGGGGGGTGGTGGTGGGTTTAAAPNATAGAGGGGGDDGIAALLGWLVPAILLGSIWLALTSFFIYRYACPVRNPFRNVCKRRPKPVKVKPAKPPPPPKVKPPPKDPPKPVQPRNPPPPKKPPTPPPTPKKVIPPPPPPEPEPDPYLFGFWKERYTDQDILSNKPQRDAQPMPIEKMPKDIIWGNQPAPENLKLGPPTWPSPRPGNSPYPDPIPPLPKGSNSKCIIM